MTAKLQRLALNVPEVARLLNCSKQAVYAMAKGGALPVVRVGTKRVVVPVAVVEELLHQPVPRELLEK